MVPYNRAGRMPPRIGTPRSVSDRMRLVRQRDTAPELRVRSLLRTWGIGYRVCPRDLPGRPDVANKRRRWAVFVHGCFWHGHHGCRLATIPKTNTDFWLAKLASNRERDARKVRRLRELGFRVVVVWQCQLDDTRVLRRLRIDLLRHAR